MANKEDIQSKREKMTPPMDELAGAAKIVQSAAEQLVEFSRSTAKDAGVEIKETAKIAEDVLASGVKKSTSLIKKYPLESALVCFGVGVVAGMLLKNRD